MSNRRSCQRREAATRFSSAQAVLLVLLGGLGVTRARAADEARAATHVPAAAEHAAPTTDPLLGGLSLGSRRDPIAVSADSLVYDNRTRVLTYSGGVVATQGDMKLESQTLTVALDDQADSRLKEVVASGAVRLSKGARWATAGRAVFDQTRRTVVLSDNAVLHDGLNQVSGEQVTVYLDEERSEVKGGNGRVKALLFPSQSATAGGGERTTP
jgi:lipopolysaccharide export system protein LptA